MATKSTIKLPGLSAPIVLDRKAVAAHSVGPTAPDTLALQKRLQKRQTREIQKVAARRSPVRRSAATKLVKKFVKKLDVGGFLTDLAGQLSTQTEGFAMEISYPHHGGRRHESRVNGYAIDPVDPGSKVWTKKVVQHVASISKLVTAMAMTRRLHDLEISPKKGHRPLFASVLDSGTQYRSRHLRSTHDAPVRDQELGNRFCQYGGGGQYGC